MTYSIDDKYLLRIHTPKNGFNNLSIAGDLNQLKRRENELMFLRHLDSEGISVQLPIYNRRDELVTVCKQEIIHGIQEELLAKIVVKNGIVIN